VSSCPTKLDRNCNIIRGDMLRRVEAMSGQHAAPYGKGDTVTFDCWLDDHTHPGLFKCVEFPDVVLAIGNFDKVQAVRAPTLLKYKGIVEGRKDDGDKLDMTLFDDMPRALSAVAEVMQWAITEKKPVPYTRGSWLGVKPDRYRAAILRHNNAACKDKCEPRFSKDDETKLLHLSHIACSALMALENTLREIEGKQDGK
jgi:Domain of unknown function (DUF5664)